MKWRKRRLLNSGGGELGFDALPLIDVLSSSLGAAMMLFLIVVVAPQGGDVIRDALGVSSTPGGDTTGTESLSPVDSPGLRTSLMMMVEIEGTGLTGNWKSLGRNRSIIEKNFSGDKNQQWRVAVSDASLIRNSTGFRLSAPYGSGNPAKFSAQIVYGSKSWSMTGNLSSSDQFLFDFIPNSPQQVRCRPHSCVVTEVLPNG